MIKGILKRHSLPGDTVAPNLNECTPDSSPADESPKLKRVSFDGAEPTCVFEADEWDRSPAEVTLRLTYKDVVELRELNISLVRTGPLMMERTPSRRPTRQRTPSPPSPQPAEPSIHVPSPSITHSNDLKKQDEAPSPSSPFVASSPRLSPSYQYQPFTSQSLPPLLEDASSSSVEDLSGRRGCGHSTSVSDSYFTFCPVSASSTPVAMALSTPLLKGVPSPALAPPSPLTLSSVVHSRSPSPKPASRPGSPIPLFRHHAASPPSSPRLKAQSTPASPRSLSLPRLSRRASVPDKLALEQGEKPAGHSLVEHNDMIPALRALNFTGTHNNSSSPSISMSKSPLSSPALALESSVPSRKSTMSLMGWELRRTGSGSGKRSFGLVRKGSAGA